MLEGEWYNVDYIVFIGHLGISEEELQRERGFTLSRYYLSIALVTCTHQR